MIDITLELVIDGHIHKFPVTRSGEVIIPPAPAASIDSSASGNMELRPGVDYDISVCPICGSADPNMDNHPGCMDQIGVWPEPGYNDDI